MPRLPLTSPHPRDWLAALITVSHIIHVNEFSSAHICAFTSFVLFPSQTVLAKFPFKYQFLQLTYELKNISVHLNLSLALFVLFFPLCLAFAPLPWPLTSHHRTRPHAVSLPNLSTRSTLLSFISPRPLALLSSDLLPSRLCLIPAIRLDLPSRPRVVSSTTCALSLTCSTPLPASHTICRIAPHLCAAHDYVCVANMCVSE